MSWISSGTKPKALLLCIHGLGLYSGSYINFGKHLSRLGINVYAIDVRGFGSWMRNGGHDQVDFDACLNDVKTTLLSLKAANPGLPVFLLGESMGGAIALRAASMYPDLISGLISSVPSGDRFKQKKTDLKVAMQFLKGANKQFNVGSAIVDQATANPKLRRDWADNPLDRMDLSPKELIQFQSFMNDNHDSAKKITTVPVLMVEGNNDKLVKPEGTWELFNEIECEQKSFLAVPSEHLIFEEQQDKERIYDRRIDSLAAAWILSHMEDPVSKQAATEIHNFNLSGAINLIASGNYTEAQPELQKILEREPFNGEAHYWLGVALYKSANVTTAQREFATCISLGNDQVHLKDANNYIMAMKGKDFSLPAITVGDPEGSNAPINRSDISAGTPTVLAFYAPWAEQCKDIAPMFDQAHARFGDRLKLIQVNIDDHNSKNLVSQFNVGPIPTFVFLTAEGNVAKTRIGMSSFLDFAKNITTIMPR
ncbi:MAG: alpha/beta fold hydrolase [Cyanobacteria bacterium SZAS-4]|nr:alpha/beta fold hydrolase [Cyanobacteria bacterium SZAS-4]